MSINERTASVEEVALKVMSYWSEEAKAFFQFNYGYDDAESLDDIWCFLGYDGISLRSRSVPEIELQELAE
jgi:hypothetical protein